jgi:hypothetical protein
VLLLEDLHWADVSTVDVLAYLGARLAATRALILVTLRPAELLAGKHPFAQLKLDLQARGVCRELPLDFLTRADVEQYLALEFPGHDFPPGSQRSFMRRPRGARSSWRTCSGICERVGWSRTPDFDGCSSSPSLPSSTISPNRSAG